MPFQRFTGAMPYVGKFHPFPAKLVISVQCGCILHTALILQSTAVVYFPLENCNSCLEYCEDGAAQAAVHRQLNSSQRVYV